MKKLTMSPLPPYGRMPREFYAAMIERNGFPEVWRGNAKEKLRFLDDTEALLRVLLEVENPWDLVRHELRETIHIARELERRCEGSYGPVERKHERFFREEDEATLGASLHDYSPWLSERSPIKLTELFEISFDVHMGALDLLLKLRFQRPRPYQTAQMLVMANEAEFEKLSHLAVRTALSPAFPGGHCYEATLNFAFAFCRMQASGVNVSADEAMWLARYAADIPDRRIMGGLHYPLDSVASWILAYEVGAKTFPLDWVDDARRFMAKSIRHSRVFALLKAGKFAHYKKVHKYLLDRIPELGTS